MAVVVTIEFVKPSADRCLKDGREDKSQLASKVSMSEKNLINEPQPQTNWRRRLEILLLTCVILAICALFVTPTILYALPPLGSGVVSLRLFFLLTLTVTFFSLRALKITDTK